MTLEYPGDADGDALRRVVALGVDVSQPIEIEFFVAVPDCEAGENVGRLAALAGYHLELTHDDEQDTWDCVCRKTMLATYAAIVAAQSELDDLSRPFGGSSDGWGTWGPPSAS